MPTLVEELALNPDFQSITLDDASAMTSSFQANNPNPDEIIGGMFGKAALQALLAQDSVAAMRYYFAYDANGNITLVLTAVDMSLNDMADGRLCERSIPCPTQCSTGNALNGL